MKEDDPMNFKDRMSELERQRSIQDTQVKHHECPSFNLFTFL